MLLAKHRGVYGIWTNSRGHVGLVRKSRGPYTGLLDLPGGSPEPGERSEETLLRELDEECGIRDPRVRSWHEFDLMDIQDSSGRPIEYRDSGLIAVLDVAEGPADVSGVEESLQARSAVPAHWHTNAVHGFCKDCAF